MQEVREGAAPGWAGRHDSRMRVGMVYAMTNAAAGNEVIAFRRVNDGTLTRLNAYPTGGNGTGTTKVGPPTPPNGIDPLTSQGSLSFSRDGGFLFAVNAGSDSITSFRVADDGMLVLADVEPSGGSQPNSLNERGNLLYVSNVGNAANSHASNITGFRVANDGRLAMIPGSTRSLSAANAQPACVVFSPYGSLLAVSELTTNRISIFSVRADGVLTGPTVNRSSGASPFGACFLSTGSLLVTETSGALSSYLVGADGRLAVLSGSVRNGQMATCWVVPARDERFAYTSNAGSGTITSYRINSDGTLTVAENVAGAEGPASGPIDNGVSEDGRYFYVLNGGLGSIAAYRIESDGRLTRLQTVTGQGLPNLGAQGLAVR